MPLTRRRFLRTAVHGAAGAAAASPLALAAQSAAPGAPPTPPAGTVTAETLAAAEKIAGLEFTAAQRTPLVKGVADRSTALRALRSNPLANGDFPAVVFDPRFAGIRIPDTAPAAPPSATPAAPAAPTRRPADADLLFLPLRQLGALLRARLVTSRELTALALARLAQHDPALLTVVTLTPERAYRQADAADAELRAGRDRGPLHGIPWGAKDLLAVRGYPTTWGAAQFRDRVIDTDAEAVRRLDAAGAVLVAKLSLGALASGDTWFRGQTKCPWNPALGSSGSSAGPCAAVAAGLVPFALGSETLGSIVSPCTRNAVTGLRPTYGRISRAGAMALSWSMDKLGPIGRTVDDCALIFAALHGADPADPTAVDAPFAWSAPADLRGFRLGVLAGQFDQPGDWLETNRASVEVLRRLGAELVPFTLPDAPLTGLRQILTIEAAAAFDDFTRSGAVDDLVAPQPSNWATSLREVRYLSAVDYLQANRLRVHLLRELENRLAAARLDAWVSLPSGPQLTFTNLTGHPCVCVPAGFRSVPNQPADSPRRLTAALTFHAALYRDDRALAAAHAFQAATDWHLRRPPVA